MSEDTVCIVTATDDGHFGVFHPDDANMEAIAAAVLSFALYAGGSLRRILELSRGAEHLSTASVPEPIVIA